MIKRFSTSKDLIKFIESSKRVTDKTDLSRMVYFTKLLNNPQDDLLTIHVSGTNGKGSVVSFISQLLQKCNIRVGIFTSPYITIFNERIQINDEYIKDEDLLNIGNIIIDKLNEVNSLIIPSFFEFITLIMLVYFKNQKVDVCIIEVGIGGRLDATNIINSKYPVITSISYDHMDILGNSLEEILNEKLGIVKPNSNLFINVDKKFHQQVLNYLSSSNSVTFLNKENIIIHDVSLNGTCFSYKTNHCTFENVKIDLLGFHQVENAILALEVVEFFLKNENFHKKDLPNLNVLLIENIKNTKWPGRLELIKKPNIIIDGAHNVDGIKRVCDFINEIVKNKIKVGIVAISDNKAKDKMIKIIDDTFDYLIFTKFDYKRTSDAHELFNLSNSHNKKIVLEIPKIIEEVKNLNANYFITFLGSLYFISEVRKYFKE